jgi:hypothetical protein
MTKAEFLSLKTSEEMLKALQEDDEIRAIATSEKLYDVFNRKSSDEYKAFMIEHFGYYDPNIHFDPMPNDPTVR